MLMPRDLPVTGHGAAAGVVSTKGGVDDVTPGDSTPDSYEDLPPKLQYH